MQPTLQVGFGCLGLRLAELPASVVAATVLVILPSKNLGTNLKLVKQLLDGNSAPHTGLQWQNRTQLRTFNSKAEWIRCQSIYPTRCCWNGLGPYIYDCYKAVVQEQ